MPGLLFVYATLVSLVGCTSSIATARSPAQSSPPDSALFAAVLESLASDSLGTLRVDPRPLRPDPRLVTLHAVGLVIPDKVDPRAHEDPFAVVDSVVLRARAAHVAGAGLRRTDALVDMKCPGVMIPRSAGTPPSPACPQTERFESVLIALPRPGGVYWPNNRDERSQYEGREVYSVRVIARTLTPDGSAEQSSDYVFERDADGRWRLLKRVPLLIVE